MPIKLYLINNMDTLLEKLRLVEVLWTENQ